MLLSGQSWCSFSDAGLISPWVLTSQNKNFEIFIHEENPPPGSLMGGHWALDLNSDNPYTIAQSIKTQVGKAYHVTFVVLRNGACNDGPEKKGYIQQTPQTPIRRRGGGSKGSQPEPISPNKPNPDAMLFSISDAINWKDVDFNFTAGAGTTLLEIGSTSTGACGPIVDNVKMYLV
jgi:hypothetical protein